MTSPWNDKQVIVKIQCPSCSKVLSTQKQIAPGTKVKCPQCQNPFTVGRVRQQRPAAPPPQADAWDDYGDDWGGDYAGGGGGYGGYGAPAPAPKPVAKKKAKQKQSLGLIIGGSVLVTGLLCTALILALRPGGNDDGDKKNNDVAKKFDDPNGRFEPGETPPMPFSGDDPPFNPGNDPPFDPGDDPPVSDPPFNNPPVNNPPVNNPPVNNPPINNPPIGNPPKQLVKAPIPPPGGNKGGQLDPAVLKKVKQSTVFLRVTSRSGERSTGTGFFAVDRKSIVTNAHVVGMLRPGSDKPRKIEVVINSGEPNEFVAAGDVVAVDNSSDLAVVRVSVRGKSLPILNVNPLKVFSATKLIETQSVYVFGFPFGERLGKNITVTQSSVSSLRKRADGTLKEVQVNGGMHPGNSGGPVTDKNGSVIGVAVAGIPGTNVNFAIPGDALYSMLAGRISSMSFRDPAQKGNRFNVPVKVKFIDPFNHVTNVKLTWWIGNAGRKGPGVSTTEKPKPILGDTPHKEIACHYSAGDAMATISVPAVPNGKRLYVRASYATKDGGQVYVQPSTYDPGPLLEQTKAKLTHQPRRGQTLLTLNSKSTFRFDLFGGEEFKFLSHLNATLVENTTNVSSRGNATRKYGVGRLRWNVSINGEAPPKSRKIQEMLKDLKFLKLNAQTDHTGKLTRRNVDVTGMPFQSAAILEGMGERMLESLDAVSVPVPPRICEPGYQWTDQRQVPIDTMSRYISAKTNVTHTYKGMGTYKGKRVAVIAFEGRIAGLTGPVTISGTVRGKCYWDMQANQIYSADSVFDIGMILRDDEDTLKASGQLRVHLERTPIKR